MRNWAFRKAGMAVAATLTLATLTFFNPGCITENAIRKNEPKGDTTLVSQAFLNKTEIRDNKPFADSLVNAPSIEELEKYKPFGGDYEGMFHGPRRGEAIERWKQIEAGLPFELTKEQWKQYTNAQKNEIQDKWMGVRINMRVAFMTKDITSPEMAAEGLKNGSISEQQKEIALRLWDVATGPLPEMHLPDVK